MKIIVYVLIIFACSYHNQHSNKTIQSTNQEVQAKGDSLYENSFEFSATLRVCYGIWLAV